MVNLKKPSGDSSLKGQLKSAFKAFFVNPFEQLGHESKTMAKEVLKTPLMITQSQNWGDEWLKDKDNKDKPPVSEKTGESSSLDPGRISKQFDQTEIAKIQQSLKGQFSRPSTSSEYGQQLAQKRQKENTPIYDQIQKEKEQQKQQQIKQQNQAQRPLASPQKGVSNRGSVLTGKKKKKTPLDLERSPDARASGGK